MGILNHHLKNFKESIKSLEKGIKLTPKEDGAFITLAANYIELENYPKALENFEKAIDINPNLKWAQRIK